MEPLTAFIVTKPFSMFFALPAHSNMFSEIKNVSIWNSFILSNKCMYAMHVSMSGYFNRFMNIEILCKLNIPYPHR